MNPTKQVWALFKFTALGNALLVIYPVIFTLPLWIQYSGHHSSLDLDFALFSSYQSLIFIGLLAMVTLAPEVFYAGSSYAVAGTEFLLTRAIDRPLLVRARVALFYVAFLVPSLIGVVIALAHPTLQVTEYEKFSHQQILTQLPESVAKPADKYGRSTDIAIPNGNLLVEEWHLAEYVIAALAAQLLIFLLYPLKWRRFWVITAFFVLAFSPLVFLFRSRPANELSMAERLFFLLMDHQILFWAAAFGVLILVQRWCERQFARLEQ